MIRLTTMPFTAGASVPSPGLPPPPRPRCHGRSTTANLGPSSANLTMPTTPSPASPASVASRSAPGGGASRLVTRTPAHLFLTHLQPVQLRRAGGVKWTDMRWTDRQVPSTIHQAISPRFHRLQVTHALPTCGRNGMNIPVCNAGRAIATQSQSVKRD